jgi:hypothetical protein
MVDSCEQVTSLWIPYNAGNFSSHQWRAPEGLATRIARAHGVFQLMAVMALGWAQSTMQMMCTDPYRNNDCRSVFLERHGLVPACSFVCESHVSC